MKYIKSFNQTLENYSTSTTTYRLPDWLLKWQQDQRIKEHEEKHSMYNKSKKPFIRKVTGDN